MIAAQSLWICLLILIISVLDGSVGLSTGGNYHWEVHQTIRELKEHGMPVTAYDTMAKEVGRVLQRWAQDHPGQPEWRSLLNKANLLHEVEESIVALHHLKEWVVSCNTTQFVAIDACCGKGVYSMLLCYLAPQHFQGLEKIIMFDKDQKIDWSHVHAANQYCEEEGRPFLELWTGINLHEHDKLVEKLESQGRPLAVTGIHLCKTLSPTFVGVINTLGPKHAPYICLAPCCLPRSQTLLIPEFETPMQRNVRIYTTKNRLRATQRRRSKCYVCLGDHHVRDCPEQVNSSTQQWNETVQDALVSLPCWNCGVVGHRRADCTEIVEVKKQPVALLDMSSLKGSNLFESYCGALSHTIQDVLDLQVVNSGLVSASHDLQHGNNWNQNRKSLFIVASRACH